MTSSKISALLLLSGTFILAVGTYMHPSHEDPKNVVLAFKEYALSEHWVSIHMLQLLGVVLLMSALVLLVIVLSERASRVFRTLGTLCASASLVLAVMLQAVDGVALKRSVDAWMVAPSDAAFYAALAVRHLEIGFAGMLALSSGITILIYSMVLYYERTFSRGLVGVGIVTSVAMVLSGFSIIHTGFSNVSMMLNTIGGIATVVWTIWLAARLWKRG